MTITRLFGVVVTWIGFESHIDTRWSGVYFEAPWVTPKKRQEPGSSISILEFGRMLRDEGGARDADHINKV